MTNKERGILRLLAKAGAPVNGEDVVHAVRGVEFERIDTSLVLEALFARGFITRGPGPRGRVYTITESGVRALGEAGLA